MSTPKMEAQEPQDGLSKEEVIEAWGALYESYRLYLAQRFGLFDDPVLFASQCPEEEQGKEEGA